MATRLQRVARAIRFIMIAADSNTMEEFERERRTMSEDDREFSVLIANQLIELVDALFEGRPAVTVKLDGKTIAKAVSEATRGA